MNHIEVHDLFFSFNGREVFQNLEFQLRRGEIYAVVGASGSGKSVLLKLLGGLLSPESGKVEIEGIDLSNASRRELQALRVKMGFVFQDEALISNMSIYDNVALPLRYHTGMEEGEVEARVAEKMALFEVDRHAFRSLPSQLSLGLRKRAALSRALVLEPKLLFLDEPLMGLGGEENNRIAGILKEYRERVQASFLLVTGEWSLAFDLADRIGLLERGRIVSEGTAQEIQAEYAKMKEWGFPSNP